MNRAVRTMFKVLGAIAVVVIVMFIAVGWLSLHWVYAEGERAGYVQKFSRKGWVCKTWEGQVAMVTMPGTVADKFDFTVRDEAVAAKLNANIGKRLELKYEQRRWIPNSCFGETEYWVSAVSVVEEPALH